MNKRKAVMIALAIVGILVLVLGLALAFSWINGSRWADGGGVQSFGWRSGYRFPDRYFGHMGIGFGWIPIVGLVILIASIAGFGRRYRHDAHRPGEHESAMDILRNEFAEGRIDKDEFLSRKQVLEEGEK